MKRIFAFIVLTLTSGIVHSQVKMQRIEGGLLFTENNQRILLYQIDPKNKDGLYERCNYIHPLWTPDGTVLTKDFPEDHLYHRGIFWAWHQIWIDGKRISDGWELKNFTQKVGEVEYSRENDGSAILNTEIYWKSDQWLKDGNEVPYLKENSTITIHSLTDNFRKIDFKIELLALEENLEIGGSEDENGYGGFSVRLILPDNVSISGLNGTIEPNDEAINTPGFINISGELLNNNKKGGIVIVDNPDNPEYPQHWILSTEDSIQNAAYPGNKKISVSTSIPLVLKYSLIVYSGKMTNKKIRKILN